MNSDCPGGRLERAVTHIPRQTKYMDEFHQLKPHILDQFGFRSQPNLPLPVGSVNMDLSLPMNQVLSKNLNKPAMFLALEEFAQ